MLKINQGVSSRTNTQGGMLYMLKAVIFSYILSFILLFFASVVAAFGSFSDIAITICANIATAISTVYAGFLVGHHFEKRGILYGALSGIIYTFLLYIAGSIASKSMTMSTDFLTAFIIGLICGGVGGIVGINTKPSRRR